MNYVIDKSKERSINKYRELMDKNSSEINDLEMINNSLKESMVKDLKILLDSHFGLNARLINIMQKKTPWGKESIKQVHDRLIAYYDLDVVVTSLGTLGWGDDAYYVYFTHGNMNYQLTIPNLRNVENYENCYGGRYMIHVQESEHTWGFVKGVESTYYPDELINEFKKAVDYKEVK